MKNIEKIKSIICNSILSMSEEKLFEFISEYEEDEETYFLKKELFTCSKCHDLYGDCTAHKIGTVDYDVCKDRFSIYCNSDSFE